MGVIIGIDVGGSTTKIVGFTKEKQLIEPMLVRAADPITSVYGAFGKFTKENGFAMSDVDKVMITGVGADSVNGSIFDLPCEMASEFRSFGHGGLYLSGLDRAIVVSMGTGTATAFARRENGRVLVDYLGGTGVGGGTLMGLSKRMLAMDSIDNIVELAKDGDLSRVDLQVQDISSSGTLPGDMTASNFGKLSDVATKADVALGIINMICETVAMVSLFAARGHGIEDIVLTGNLSTVPQAEPIFRALSEMFNVRFILPRCSQYATVIGTALAYFDQEK